MCRKVLIGVMSHMSEPKILTEMMTYQKSFPVLSAFW